MQKLDAVVSLSPGDRSSHMLDLYKKYKFIPIILRVRQMETPEIAKDIDDVIAKLKKRIPKIVVIDDKGKMKHAIKALSDFNVRAIVPYEETVPYGDKLAKILKIAGNDPKTSLLRKNKDSLNQLLAKKGIRSIKSLILKSNTTVDKIVAYFKNHFPLVLKPVYGSSSVNVFVVKNQKELAEKINFFRTLDRKTLKILGDIVIQEFITGTEYVANYISNNGRHILTDL
jgi:glutathione synthase/RimK-type ligase-like ATP-grasp enzyme